MGNPQNTDYRKFPRDGDGYVDAVLYKPAPFDLCHLLSARGKYYVGWWCGKSWDGKRIEDEMIIVRWKDIRERMEKYHGG